MNEVAVRLSSRSTFIPRSMEDNLRCRWIICATEPSDCITHVTISCAKKLLALKCASGYIHVQALSRWPRSDIIVGVCLMYFRRSGEASLKECAHVRADRSDEVRRREPLVSASPSGVQRSSSNCLAWANGHVRGALAGGSGVAVDFRPRADRPRLRRRVRSAIFTPQLCPAPRPARTACHRRSHLVVRRRRSIAPRCRLCLRDDSSG